jgi:hypothetical protein
MTLACWTLPFPFALASTRARRSIVVVVADAPSDHGLASRFSAPGTGRIPVSSKVLGVNTAPLAKTSILEKTLETIGEHPEILRILARSLSQVVRETLVQSLATLDSALEGLEVGDTVDEALLGSLGEVRDALEGVLERSEREAEGAAQAALGEGGDTTAPA